MDFGENRPIPCAAISLSEPVCSPVIESQNKSDELKEPSKAESVPKERMKPSRQEDVAHHSENKSQNKTTVAPPEVHESFGDKVLHVVDAVKEFSEKHPVLTRIVKWGGAAAIVTAAVVNNSSGGGRSSGNGGSDYSSSDLFDDYSGQADDNDDYGDSSGLRDYPGERSSPREHDVSGYDRQQNGKTVHVNPYKRGGRHNED